MLQLTVTPPFCGKILAVPDPRGIDTVYAIIKSGFMLDQDASLAPEPAAIQLEDKFHGEPGKSSLKAASDISLIKPATDVLLTGCACAPGGVALSKMDVSLSVGSVRKSVRVFGDRLWERGIFGYKASAPEKFQKMPLIWERAFGGTKQVKEDPPKFKVEERNPVGVGFHVRRSAVRGSSLPNLEDPGNLIKSWKSRPCPAGFGPICPSWQPRRSCAGTYDGAWQKKRAPFLPNDFKPRFFQLAPPDLIASGYLKGGEPCQIIGMSEQQNSLRFALPRWQVSVTFRIDNQNIVQNANIDTVSFNCEKMRLELTWRAACSCDKRTLRVREVEAHCRPF